MTDTVEGLKAALRIDHDEDDGLLLGKIAAASAWIVSYCGLSSMPDDVPADILEAIGQLAAHLYVNRGGEPEAVEIPETVKALVASHYRWTF